MPMVSEKRRSHLTVGYISFSWSMLRRLYMAGMLRCCSRVQVESARAVSIFITFFMMRCASFLL